MSRDILLVEPAYNSKYPPLGLMKIAAYHKRKGDHVVFVKGCVALHKGKRWDRVYVSSLFTYHWKATIEAIRYYSKAVSSKADIFVGGVLATLLCDELVASTGATVVPGLLDRPGILDEGDRILIDALTPDYSILASCDYVYELQDCYIGYATRGCPRTCTFCAVHHIEPQFVPYLPLRRQVQLVEELYGPKRDLVLLDNNVLASDCFADIISDIKDLGFERGATFSYRSGTGRTTTVKRSVDFNQGLDSRLLTDEKMGMLSEIAIRPVRIAFDHIELRELYEEKVRLAARHGMPYLSNYILYNFKDKPNDFYTRLKINIDLNEELGLHIFSFPMRYLDLRSKNRRVSTPGNLGEHWNPKYLRAIQCVLLRTRGLVGTRREYFLKAFGNSVDEYQKILIMPEEYIIHRLKHERDGSTEEWWSQVCSLSSWERSIFDTIVQSNAFRDVQLADFPMKVCQALSHYYIPTDRNTVSSTDNVEPHVDIEYYEPMISASSP